MLQRLSVRGKILAVVAVPILVLLLAAGVLTANAINDLNRARTTVSMLTMLDRGKTFSTAWRIEADAAANYISAWNDNSSLLLDSRTNVDRALSTLESAAENGGNDAALWNSVQQALEGGQVTAAGAAISLNEARQLNPTGGEDGERHTWPSDAEIELASASLAAIGSEISAASLGLEVSPQVQAAITGLIANLGLEAERQTRFLTETPTLREDFENSLTPVNSALSVFRAAIDNLPSNAQTDAVRTPLDIVQRDLEQLAANRASTRQLTWGDATAHAWYTAVMTDMNSVISQTILVVDDAELVQWLSAYESVDSLMQEVSSEGSQIARVLRPGAFVVGEQAIINNQVARTDFAHSSAQRAVSLLDSDLAIPAFGASNDATNQQGFGPERNRVTQGVLGAAARSTWPGQVRTELAAIAPVYDATLADSRDLANAHENSVVLSTVATAAGSLLVVGLSLLVALVIARSIVNPLRRLTTTATAVRQELPRLVERVALPGETVDVSEVQIPVESTDEVGRLAEAFNSVNAATLAIAAEQSALRGSISEMFVNVARRDQVLLNRQLSSIDEMERTEDNPDTLTKLFALDHLATRMRRNSESLLVLAGIDTGRRLRRPMPLSDVIRTASSEIELYERVQLELDADPAMLGHSALTAAHLFAELLENATVFSDPGTPVVVRTTHEGDSFVVRIIDSGIGMTADERAEANSRVASTAASEILGAQRLGLFVVGRIARRIGARVVLESKEGEGTTATVTMSPSLFDLSASDADMPHASTTASDAAMHAPAALTGRDMSNEVLDASSAVANASERAGSAAAQVPSYAPAMIEEGTSLSGRPAMSDGLEDLLAEDAAAAPVAQEVDLDALTDGVTPAGLPTRRKRAGESGDEAGDEAVHTAIGLPARATEAQLSALAAQADSEFTPLVSAPEVSPETVEQRAAMFRGFRARRSGPDGEVTVAPDAESLGQAIRRGAAVLPTEPATPVVPSLEPDEDEAVAVPVVPSETEPAVASAVHTGPEDDGSQVPAAVVQEAQPQEMVIPGFAEDEPAAPEPTPVVEAAESASVPQVAPEPSPYSEPAGAGVQSVSLGDSPFAASPVAPQQSPYSEPTPVVTQPFAQSPEPAFTAAATAPEQFAAPSLDDVIGAPHGKDKGGFFGKLFRKGKEAPAAEPSAATSLLSSMPHSAPLPGVITPDQLPAPQADAFAPNAAPSPQVLPGYGDTAGVSALAAPMFTAPPATSPGAFEAPAEAAEPAADAFGASGWGAPPAQADTGFGFPAGPGGLTEEHPYYTRDELAQPVGWETAGESALQAAEPEQMTYHPVVQIATPQNTDDTPDITSDVFSEFRSLTAERPKVTKAGLQRRRPADAPQPVVTPIEETVEVVHVDRDPNAIRSRFSSFYSGTKRAKSDVEAFERGSHNQVTEN